MIHIGFETPTILDRFRGRRRVVGQDDTEFPQGFGGQGLLNCGIFLIGGQDEIEVGRGPGDFGLGGFSLDGVLQGRGLIRRVFPNPISERHIPPVVGGVRIQSDGGLVLRDGGALVVSYQVIIAAQIIAVVGVASVQPHRTLQASQIGPAISAIVKP